MSESLEQRVAALEQIVLNKQGNQHLVDFTEACTLMSMSKRVWAVWSFDTKEDPIAIRGPFYSTTAAREYLRNIAFKRAAVVSDSTISNVYPGE